MGAAGPVDGRGPTGPRAGARRRMDRRRWGTTAPAPSRGGRVSETGDDRAGTPAPGRARMVGDGPLARDLAAALRAGGADVVDAAGSGIDAMVFAPWDPGVVLPVPFAELTDA